MPIRRRSCGRHGRRVGDRGELICRRLADEGATVAALDLSVDRAQEVVADLPRASAIYADVSRADSVEDALTQVEPNSGR